MADEIWCDVCFLVCLIRNARWLKKKIDKFFRSFFGLLLMLMLCVSLTPEKKVFNVTRERYVAELKNATLIVIHHFPTFYCNDHFRCPGCIYFRYLQKFYIITLLFLFQSEPIGPYTFMMTHCENKSRARDSRISFSQFSDVA